MLLKRLPLSDSFGEEERKERGRGRKERKISYLSKKKASNIQGSRRTNKRPEGVCKAARGHTRPGIAIVGEMGGGGGKDGWGKNKTFCMNGNGN